MSNENYHILIVDDDPLFHSTTHLGLPDEYTFSGALDIPQMLKKLEEREGKFDLLLLDLRLDDSTELVGLNYIRKIKEDYKDMPVIAITADNKYSTAIEAIKKGADDFIFKSEPNYNYWDELIKKAIHIAQTKMRLTIENKYLIEEIKELKEVEFIGDSPSIRKIRKDIKDLAKKEDIIVLFTGETGVGKEVAARYYHKCSHRNQAIFKPIVLREIDENLLSRELFGHTKGVYVDASESRKGLLRQAEGGIILLDEIGEAQEKAQIIILRLLETRRIRPIGMDEEIPINIQILAATKRNLKKSIKDRKFRSDLYYRFGYTVNIPPLRKRSEDIPLLINYYLKRENCSECTSATAMDMLRTYYWGGNVRELQDAVRYMVRKKGELEREEITIDCLPIEIQNYVPSRPEIGLSFIKKIKELFSNGNFDKAVEIFSIIDEDKLSKELNNRKILLSGKLKDILNREKMGIYTDLAMPKIQTIENILHLCDEINDWIQQKNTQPKSSAS